jgi:predicted esterase
MKKYAPIIIIVIVLGSLYWYYKAPTIKSSNGIKFDYIVKYPKNTDKSAKLPMLIALHGDGDTPINFYKSALNRLKNPIRIILIKAPISYSFGNTRWPWKIDDMKKYGEAISDISQKLSLKYPTLGKPAILGFSGGAIMSYFQALKYGDTYSYIFPISGSLSKELIESGVETSDVKVYSFHGDSDDRISFINGENASNSLKIGGIDVKFTKFKGGHGFYGENKRYITKTIEENLDKLR